MNGIIGINRIPQSAAAMLIIVVLLSFPFVANGKTPGGDQGFGTEFVLKNAGFEGKLLKFYYTVPYPGLTKVKLFNESGEMIWRNQYVYQPGNRELHLNGQMLESGKTYVFQFDYKLTTVTREIYVP